MIRWKKPQQQRPSPSPPHSRSRAAPAAEPTAAAARAAAARSRSARSSRPTTYDPVRRGVGQPLAVLPGGVRHAAARDPRGHHRAVARDRVVVQRGQHRAHAHPPRRRHVHATDPKLTGDVVAQNLQRFKDGTSPDAGYFAGVASIRGARRHDGRHHPQRTRPRDAQLPHPRPRPRRQRRERSTARTSPRHPIGSGPYILDTAATVTGTSYVYTKNPDYWNPDVQHYDKLTINVLGDPTAALNAIKAGEANGVRARRPTTTSPRSRAPAGPSTPTSSTSRGCCCSTAPARWTPRSPTSSVRQAINYAFDREALLTALADRPRHRDHPGVPRDRATPTTPSSTTTTRTTPRRRKELLAEAGLRRRAHASRCRASTLLGDGDLHADRAAARRRRHHGRVHRPGADNFIADLLAPKFPASFMALEQNPDWQLIQFMIAPTAVFNPFHYEDPKVDEYIEEIQYGDEATQAPKAKELNTYIVEQAWFAPFYRVQGSFATDAEHDASRCCRPTPTRRSTTSSPRAESTPGPPADRPRRAGHHAPLPSTPQRSASCFAFILRRVLSGVVLIFVISVIAFTLLYAGGGDIARRILGQNATPGDRRPEGRRARPRPPARSCSTGTGSPTPSRATSAAPGSPASSSPSASRAASPSPSRS